ncbi:MAG: hypothetical protein ACN6ON_00535 [Sphingobacterium sp.]
MKKNKENLSEDSVAHTYEAPHIKTQKVELEYCISTGSVQSSITESWETETQTKDLNW